MIIKLNPSGETVVDVIDYNSLIKNRWRLSVDGYAFRWIIGRKENGHKIRHRVLMHRQILNAPSNMQVDHIDHNKLNNQRNNLRLVTARQNQINRLPKAGKYKGVHKDGNSWRAIIAPNGKPINLGFFRDPIEAAKLYDRAAIYYFGEFAYLNFPDNKDKYQPYIPVMKKRKYKGAYYYIKTKKWRSSIQINKKLYWIGNFHTEEEAARAYDNLAKKVLGPLAKLNFP